MLLGGLLSRSCQGNEDNLGISVSLEQRVIQVQHTLVLYVTCCPLQSDRCKVHKIMSAVLGQTFNSP